MDLQKLIDSMNEVSRGTRSNYHLTLGDIIEKLSDLDPEMTVEFDFNECGPTEPHSYRGYYSDLSFESTPELIEVSKFRSDCESSLNKTFEGYKGGDFEMDENTPLWVSSYGVASGRAIIGLDIKAKEVVILTKDAA